MTNNKNPDIADRFADVILQNMKKEPTKPMKQNNTAMLVLFVLFILVLIATGPLLTIFALNSLFPALAIPYTFWNWLSVVILAGVFKSNVTYKKD